MAGGEHQDQDYRDIIGELFPGTGGTYPPSGGDVPGMPDPGGGGGGFDPFDPGSWDWEGIYGNMAEMQLMGMREAIASQEKMMHMALDLQWRMFEQQRADVKPWRDAGIKSLEWLDEALERGAPYYKPPEMKDYEKSPYYDFLLSEGQKAQDRSASAKGMLLSGPQIKGTERFAQQTASLDVDNWLKRYYDKANFDISQYYQSLAPHQAMSGQGEMAAGTMAAAAQAAAAQGTSTYNTAGTNIGNYYMQGYGDAAESRATGQLNSLMMPYQHYMNQQYMEQDQTQWNQYLEAQRQADRGRERGGFFETLIGGVLPFIPGFGSSDARLKTDIEPVGTEKGVKLYKFRYKEDPSNQMFVGVMAQDLLKTHPEAVIKTPSGYLAVHYNKLGIQMKTLETWMGEHSHGD